MIAGERLPIKTTNKKPISGVLLLLTGSCLPPQFLPLLQGSSSCPSPPCPPPHLQNRPPIWSPFCWPSRLFLAQIKVPITIIGTLQVNCPSLDKCPSLKSGLTGGIYVVCHLYSLVQPTHDLLFLCRLPFI